MLDRKVLVTALLVFAVALPAAAYTIYLKDGSRIITREKYRLEEGKAILVLQNGTQTFLDAAEIDVQRTERANGGDYGTAVVLEEGRVTETPSAVPPRRQESLSDLITRRETTASARPTARRQSRDASGRGRSRAGGAAPDLLTSPRAAHRSLELAAEIQRVFRAQGIESMQVYQGTEPDRTLLELITDSEASVFRGLEVAAAALLHFRDRDSGIESFEIVMTTSARERAGQFLLTPELAEELAGDGLEVSSFFIDQVQF